MTQYTNPVGSFFLSSVQTNHSMRRDRVRPVLLLLLAASVNYNLAAFRRPAHTFGSSLLKVEKPFRALLEGDPVLVPPA